MSKVINMKTSHFQNGEGQRQIGEGTANRVLVISWQRLIEKGDTCPRCGSTEDELENAFKQLQEKLAALEIEVVLEKKELSLAEFKKNPTASNRLLFNGRLLEDILNAKTGQSKCCQVCGDEECRTTEINGLSLEIIPAEMIIRAGLKVALDL